MFTVADRNPSVAPMYLANNQEIVAMPDKLAEQVEELRRLEALAFLGVWKCEIQEGQQRDYARICGGERGSYIATVSDIEDAQLIVAVRNALPSLLTALEQYKLDAERNADELQNTLAGCLALKECSSIEGIEQIMARTTSGTLGASMDDLFARSKKTSRRPIAGSSEMKAFVIFGIEDEGQCGIGFSPTSAWVCAFGTGVRIKEWERKGYTCVPVTITRDTEEK